jgi:hypothetical protein
MIVFSFRIVSGSLHQPAGGFIAARKPPLQGRCQPEFGAQGWAACWSAILKNANDDRGLMERRNLHPETERKGGRP